MPMRVLAVLCASVVACHSGAQPATDDPGVETLTSGETSAIAADAAPSPSGPETEPETFPETTEPGVDVAVGSMDTAASSSPVPSFAGPFAGPFDRSRLALQIAIGEGGRAALATAPTVPVAATLFVDASAAIPVEVSLAASDDKPPVLSADTPLVIRVLEGPAAAAGLPTSFWLDPSAGDPSYLRAPLATLFYRQVGTPVARTSYARVSVDGTDYGLFIARESTADAGFLARVFGRGGSLFAPTTRADFWPWQLAGFGLLVGDEADRSALDLLVTHLALYETAMRDGNPFPFADALADLLEVDAFLDFMAVGLVVGHYGGYGGQQSDFAVYVEGAGITFVPLRLERTYPTGDAPDPTWSSSRILRICIDDAACRARWSQALERALDRAESAVFRAEASALRGIVQLELASDPKPAASESAVVESQEAVLTAITGRAGWLRANAVCLVPESVDHDGDGFSPCTDDCDDDDPGIHPGAVDVCGNLKDDDCDWRVDNGHGCPPCTRVPAYDPRWEWEICPISQTWGAARADCQSRGGELASIGTFAENEALVRAVLQFDWSDWWFGISDREVEGAFAWSDGRPLSFRDWDAGEPNDAGNGEDCGHIAGWAGGRWNDAPCDWWKFYVCERPREPSAIRP